MPSSTDMELQVAPNVPTDDSGTAGGGTSGTPFAELTEDWLPYLAALGSGTLDTDAQQQWQGAAFANLSLTNDLQDPTFFVHNLLDVPGSAAKVRLVSDSASDGATKKLRHWSKIGGALVVEDIQLNGTTQVAGAQNSAQVYRGRPLLVSNDNPTTLAGNLTISSGASGPGTQIGLLPAGYGYVSSEFRFGFSASLSDVATWTNRRTNPGVTLARPWSAGTQITGVNTIPQGGDDYNVIVAEETVQPGMPVATGLRLKMEIGGDWV